jgi:heterodisulfide reductase subunit A2
MHDKPMRTTSTGSPKNIAIVGAGIGGMQAALLLAELGRRVTMIERAPWIGGSFHLLDHTFPTDSCGLCFLEPAQSPTYCPTFECDRHPLIDLRPLTRVQAVEGSAGNFCLTLQTTPRFVDPARCDQCGLCATVCPAEGPSDYEGMLAPRKAIYPPPARGLPASYVIDPELCTRCGRCVEVCPRDAIDLDMQPESEQLTAGAVIVSPGLIPFAAEGKGEYGYGVFDNVITSLQFERLMSYSGSTGGRLLRPSDGRPARKIAFISCVGSRDASLGREYCSSICCMITAKQATVARQVDSQVESTIFFIDRRAGGRDYERYMNQRAAHPQVRYQRCQVSTIKQRQQSRDLLIEYWDDAGARRVERFDLVVLAVGFGPDTDLSEPAIERDAYGFAQAGRRLDPGASRPGIIPVGGLTGPKDIPDTVIEAAAAAALAAPLAGAQDAPDLVASPLAIRPGLFEEEPRTGVFLCGDLDGLDRHALTSEIAALPGITQAAETPSLITEAGRDAIVQGANDAGLNRLVIAYAAGRLDARLEQHLAHAHAALGLPDSATTLVNLRECIRDHGYDTEPQATALRAIQIALAGLRYRPLGTRASQQPAERTEESASRVSAAVIGAGPAGLAAAISLSDLGWDVALIERCSHPGGRLRHIERTAEGEETAGWLEAQIARVHSDEQITIYTDTEILAAERADAGHTLRIRSPQGETQIACQTVIMATGGKPADTAAYFHGADARVVTQTELETRLRQNAGALADLKTVVMIQCVDSRDARRPYCSHVCCSQAVRNAVRLRQLQPALELFILYRDMHTPGMHELAYQAARQAGVVLVRYDINAMPSVSTRGGRSLRVQVVDAAIGLPLELDADLLVLSAGIQPAGAPDWSRTLGLAWNPDGFLTPEHAKMRPLNLGAPGLFACGSALGPCFVQEALAQGRGAAAQAAVYLEQQARRRPAVETIAVVNERLCSGCELCVKTCPYEARIMDAERRVARVIDSLCAGCGACAMVCPNGATQQRLFDQRSVLEMIDAALWL